MDFEDRIRQARESARTGEPWELAARIGDAWEFVGDFATKQDAIDAARRLYQDETAKVFGISGDPSSGRYETRLEFHREDVLTIS